MQSNLRDTGKKKKKKIKLLAQIKEISEKNRTNKS
jgi:hypothetical protein